MVRGNFRGLGSSGIDRDRATASRNHVANAFLGIRAGHETALRNERVAAHADEEVGALDVRDREKPRIPDHRMKRDILRMLIHRCGGEAPLCVQAVHQWREINLRADVMSGRITDVEAVRVVAVLLFDLKEL